MPILVMRIFILFGPMVMRYERMRLFVQKYVQIIISCGLQTKMNQDNTFILVFGN